MSTRIIEAANRALFATDRCDRCGAQAFVRVTVQCNLELLFCAHHMKEHGDKLRETALFVYDQREALAQ